MSWILYLLAGLWLLDALHLRSLLGRIAVLKPSSEAATKTASLDCVFLAADGVTLDETTRSSAIAHARDQHLDFLDLLPANMPALEAMRLARVVDPLTYRQNRVARGHSAGYAILAKKEMIGKAKYTAKVTDPATLGRLAEKLKRFAPERSDLAVAPNLKISSGHSNDWPVLSALDGPGVKRQLRFRAFTLAVAAAGLFFSPMAAAIALAVFHLQVLIVFAGLKLRPRDFWIVLLFRSPLEVIALFRLAWWNWSHGAAQTASLVEARRPFYKRMLAGGMQGLFEPRRDTCPVCGSPELKVRLRTTDMLQGKPGRFVLEKCLACSHIFQNPALSLAGLEFYYGDCYDGLGAEQTRWLFDQGAARYLLRARSIGSVESPKRWLDVGAGHGHFCCAAKTIWPKAQFDGVDIGEAIREAASTGWVDQGYQGGFPEVAPKIAGTYDVVSFFHCLEHTTNPRAELAAAATALAPGGLLVIEVPDPDCPLSRWLGKYWFPWLQPQHQHLLSIGNLERLMGEQGLQVVRTYHAEAHLGFDFPFALGLLCNRLAPEPAVPWRPPPTWMSWVRYYLVWGCGYPIFLLSILLEKVLTRAGIIGSDAYGMVARRPALDSALLRRPAMEQEAPPSLAPMATRSAEEACL